MARTIRVTFLSPARSPVARLPASNLTASNLSSTHVPAPVLILLINGPVRLWRGLEIGCLRVHPRFVRESSDDSWPPFFTPFVLRLQASGRGLRLNVRFFARPPGRPLVRQLVHPPARRPLHIQSLASPLPHRTWRRLRRELMTDQVDVTADGRRRTHNGIRRRTPDVHRTRIEVCACASRERKLNADRL